MFYHNISFSQLIVIFALIAAAFAGEEGARKERQVVSYSSWPYGSVYAPAVSAYSAYPAVSTYSAYPSAYYGGVYGGVPIARAIW